MAGLDPLELACGIPLGLAQSVPALRIRGERASDSPAQGPLRALEEVCLRCLRRPPCLVSFSGGRDSSVVLAIATAVARREGLQDPIPATNRFGSVGESDETAWQELVVAHLRLRDWQRVELTTELDVVGRLAREVVAHHGVLPPFNGHFHAPLLALARGGSLLTGIGGDELFEPTHRAALARVLLGRRAPNRRLLRGAALAAMPRALRRRIARREPAFDRFTWLTDDALARLRRPLIRYCVDWSEQRHHLAGSLGAAIAQQMFELRWLRRAERTRAVHVTDDGRRGLEQVFGVAA